MAPPKATHQDDPPLWITVSLSGTAAVVLSYLWLTRGPESPFDFRGVLFPIYAPLTFGILWPIALYVQAGLLHVDRSIRPWRYRVAWCFFALSCLGWIPFIRLEIRVAKDQENTVRLNAYNQQQMLADQSAAREALRTSGILAFAEPVHGQQAAELEKFIYENQLDADQLLEASRHYQTAMILKDIADKKNCPEEALEVIYAKLTAEPMSPARGDYLPRHEAFTAIAQNPNVSAKLLVQMIKSGDAIQRIGAFQNEKLPKSNRLAYLQNGCAAEWNETRWVVDAPETPVAVLECLAGKPSAAYALIYGAHTPEHILEELTSSPDYGVSTAAKEQLQRRRSDSGKH